MIPQKILKDPYRFFFPLGILFLIIGSLVWIPSIWTEDFYPSQWHHFLMINGFIYSFIGGFLFTAVPRFSSSFFLKKWELVLFTSLYFLFFVKLPLGAYILGLLQSITILLFLLRRIVYRKQNPPHTFVFIFLGLAMNAFFNICFLGDWSPLGMETMNDFLPIVLIILGVGGRLVPGILGHKEIVMKQRSQYERPAPMYKVIPFHVYLMMVLFIASLYLPSDYSFILYLILSLIWGFFFCHLHKAPREKTSLTWGIWSASWMLILSFVLKVFMGVDDPHITHFLFVGTFFTLTLLVATRVLVAHSNQGKELENSKVLIWFVGLSYLAMLTRVSVVFMPDQFFTHLGYASGTLLIAFGIWSWKYLRLAWTF